MKIWLDVSTNYGLEIIYASQMKDVEIVGISSVFGKNLNNQSYQNIKKILKLLNMEDINVYLGSDKPLMNELIKTDSFDLPLPSSNIEDNKEHVWDALYKCAKENPNELILITTGALTNIAKAFSKYPDLAKLLKDILVVGGAIIYGDITPAAELNIYQDPYSAEVIFRSGKIIKLFSLDLTSKIFLNDEIMNKLSYTDALKNYLKYVDKKINVGELTPLLYLENNDLFKEELCGIHVETEGEYTLGKTISDIYSDKSFEENNAITIFKK